MSINNRKFSKMYQMLVDGENDILGHIAYSVYKQQKMDKIERLVEVNKRIVTEEDLASFMNDAESDIQRRFYQDRAVSLAQAFLNRSLSEQVNKIEDQLRRHYDDQVEELRRDYNGQLEHITRNLPSRGYMYGVGQSLLASFIFVAAGIILLISTGGWTGVAEILAKLAK